MSQTRITRCAILASTTLALAAGVVGVSAQPFPSKTLEFVVHTSPGGGTDVFARAITEMLSREKLITQPMLVVNRVGGHVDFTAENLSEMFGHVEAKTLRVLAVTGEKRLSAVPDAPTLVELGFPTMVLGTGRGFAMPAGVPKEAAAAMEETLRKLYQTRIWKDFAAKNMYEEKYLGSAEFAEYLQKRSGDLREFLIAVGAIQKP